MPQEVPHLSAGEYRVDGVLAEILSVLNESRMWNERLGQPATLQDLVKVLDSRRPPEERVVEVADVCRRIKDTSRIGRWIPWYDKLHEYEYKNKFYPAYRDHTIHTLQVFLLGLYLYETVPQLRSALLNRLRQVAPIPRLDDGDLFLEWWCLTSIWHDVGYPFESTEFLTDQETRETILDDLSTTLGTDPFSSAFETRRSALTRGQRRKLYKAGSYYPFTIVSASQLLNHKRAAEVLHEMWRRLGVGADAESILLELDALTTQAPAGRPPYHDHGLLGAALLAMLADEALEFLASIIETAGEHDSDVAMKEFRIVAEKGWEDLVELEGAINLALEAIGFHNVSFSQLLSTKASGRLVGEGFELELPLDREPHLFFLALTDTLQDWSRHHFLPNSLGGRYRPQVASSSMLLQGFGDRIRVSLEGEENAKEVIQKLFGGWLAREDIAALFDTGPEFTYPNRLALGVKTDLTKVHRSEEERARLSAIISKRAENARSILIRGEDTSVMKASSILDSVLSQIKEAEQVLTLTDREKVNDELTRAGINRLRAQAFALIEEGCRLPLGRVVRDIGQGGFGTVFQVESEDGREGTTYAFKLFHHADLANTEKLRLFRRGYRAMKALNDHPNVVSVVDFSEIPLGFYMDFIPGENLEFGIEQLPTVYDRLQVALKVGETVADAHGRPVQILHRDIKPANVLLDSSDDLNPVLTDFDLAWIESRQTQLTKQLYANRHYGAPEQFSPRWRKYAQKPSVDVYSFGALLHFLLIKQDPPHWSDWSDEHWPIVEERLEGQVEADVVIDLIKLLQVMLVVDPVKRNESMENIVARLSRIVGRVKSGGGPIELGAWQQQVAYKVTGRTHKDPTDFLSRTQRTRWSLSCSLGRNRKFSVRAEVGLMKEASFERISHENFRRTVARRIDDRLRAFEDAWEDVRVKRQGFPGQGGVARIKFEGLACTSESANSVGVLLSQVTRAIE